MKCESRSIFEMYEETYICRFSTTLMPAPLKGLLVFMTFLKTIYIIYVICRLGVM